VTLDEATRALAAAGIDNPRGEARLLLAAALGISREDTLTLREVSPEKEIRFRQLVERRANREPLAYITGRREFWSLNFEVGPGVLVPRPDTETLIEEALRLVPDRSIPLKIADLGTGSGAILIAALTEFPNATGIGFEASPEAFGWASDNARRLVPGRAEIRLAAWDKAEGPFDLVFSNPPYIGSKEIESLEPEVSCFEPRAALDGGPDGLSAYRSLAELLPAILERGGHGLLEIGFGQGPAMEKLFPNLEILRIAPDLSGVPRCVILRKA
jgi:release factor glutamine methyltransferase